MAEEVRAPQSLEQIFGYPVDPAHYLAEVRPTLSDQGLSLYEYAIRSYGTIDGSMSVLNRHGDYQSFFEAHRRLLEIIQRQNPLRESDQGESRTKLDYDLAEMLAYWSTERKSMLNRQGVPKVAIEDQVGLDNLVAEPFLDKGSEPEPRYLDPRKDLDPAIVEHFDELMQKIGTKDMERGAAADDFGEFLVDSLFVKTRPDAAEIYRKLDIDRRIGEAWVDKEVLEALRNASPKQHLISGDYRLALEKIVLDKYGLEEEAAYQLLIIFWENRELKSANPHKQHKRLRKLAKVMADPKVGQLVGHPRGKPEDQKNYNHSVKKVAARLKVFPSLVREAVSSLELDKDYYG